ALKNVSMAVEETDTEVLFLRRLVDGPANKSYGIYCAKLAGLPPSIIARAEELLAQGAVQEVAVSHSLGHAPAADDTGAAANTGDREEGGEYEQLSLFAEPDEVKE